MRVRKTFRGLAYYADASDFAKMTAAGAQTQSLSQPQRAQGLWRQYAEEAATALLQGGAALSMSTDQGIVQSTSAVYKYMTTMLAIGPSDWNTMQWYATASANDPRGTSYWIGLGIQDALSHWHGAVPVSTSGSGQAQVVTKGQIQNAAAVALTQGAAPAVVVQALAAQGVPTSTAMQAVSQAASAVQTAVDYGAQIQSLSDAVNQLTQTVNGLMAQVNALASAPPPAAQAVASQAAPDVSQAVSDLQAAVQAIQQSLSDMQSSASDTINQVNALTDAFTQHQATHQQLDAQLQQITDALTQTMDVVNALAQGQATPDQLPQPSAGPWAYAPPSQNYRRGWGPQPAPTASKGSTSAGAPDATQAQPGVDNTTPDVTPQDYGPFPQDWSNTPPPTSQAAGVQSEMANETPEPFSGLAAVSMYGGDGMGGDDFGSGMEED